MFEKSENSLNMEHDSASGSASVVSPYAGFFYQGYNSRNISKRKSVQVVRRSFTLKSYNQVETNQGSVLPFDNTRSKSLSKNNLLSSYINKLNEVVEIENRSELMGFLYKNEDTYLQFKKLVTEIFKSSLEAEAVNISVVDEFENSEQFLNIEIELSDNADSLAIEESFKEKNRNLTKFSNLKFYFI